MTKPKDLTFSLNEKMENSLQHVIDIDFFHSLRTSFFADFFILTSAFGIYFILSIPVYIDHCNRALFITSGLAFSFVSFMSIGLIHVSLL